MPVHDDPDVLNDADVLNARLDRLEQLWQQTEETIGFEQLVACLEGVHQSRRLKVLQNLVDLDLEVRRSRGMDPQPTEYLRVFPDAADVVQHCFDNCARPPAVVGHYRLVRQLGAGGFSTVYLAVDEQLNREVAIKLPHLDRILSRESIQSLREEAKHSVTLNHPAIARVLHVHCTATTPLAIVMEFVNGPTLRQWMDNHITTRGPDPLEAASITAVIAEALEHAHQEDPTTSRPGLIHRDVKPANILLGELPSTYRTTETSLNDRYVVSLAGHSYRPRLTDFGLAVNELTQRRQRGVIAGSLFYMSPEQARGETHLLRSYSDVWSLGVVFYELLTYRKPFGGDCPQDILEEIQQRIPRPPQELCPSVPASLQQVCLRCLQRDAGQRPTARQLATELRSWLDGGSATAVTQHSRSQKKSRVFVYGIVTSLAALSALAAVQAFRHDDSVPTALSYVDKRDPDPSHFLPDEDLLRQPPNVPAEQVRFTIRNLTSHEIELSMTNCSIYLTSLQPDYSPFEQLRNGSRFRMRLKPGQAAERPFLSDPGWYVFFVRRIDGDWFPFRQYSRDLGSRNVCTSPYILLDISHGNEEGAPYVWSFQESSQPIPAFDLPPSDEA